MNMKKVGNGYEDMREMSVTMEMSGHAIRRDKESWLQRCRCGYSGEVSYWQWVWGDWKGDNTGKDGFDGVREK